MRKRLLWILTVGLMAAVATTAIAVAEKPTVVRAGNLIITLNGGVTPKALPKAKQAPISLNVSGVIATADGSQPPPVKEVQVDFDKQGTVNARGLSVCTSGKLQARDTSSAKAACPKAIVGQGKTTVRVAFPDQAPFNASGPLVLFNGGVAGGVTTMFIHAYVNVPTPTAIVTTVKIKKINKGRYGTRAVASIPKIAGGSGSVTNYNFTVHRTFQFQGKQRSYLTAKCATGRFFAHAITTFTDGTRIAGNVVRACRGTG